MSQRRLTSIAHAAAYLQVTDRTVAAYIGKGLFPAYRIVGKRSHYVDLDEVDRALARTPRTQARPRSTKKFGPNAQIVTLVEAVER